jgi:tetratricopeptide (TPR) repeat protein
MRSAMAPLAGAVKELTVPNLFLTIRAAKKTGTAVFERAGIVKKVYFQDGDVVFASSNVDDDRLGNRLLRVGRISKAQYTASAELIKRSGKKQGTIFVELGFIAPQELTGAVQLQVTDIILSLFSCRDGSYRFDEGPLPLDDIIPLRMSSGNLILAGVRRQQWEDVRDSLPPREAVLRPATDPAALFQSADLSDNQKAVLSLIDGKRTIKEICSHSKAGDFYTLKVLYLFLALRLVEVGAIIDEEERAFAREAVQAAVAVREKKPAPGALSPAKQLVQNALDALEGQDHYQVLGVDQHSTSQEIQSAYLKLAKLYHPDRHFEPGMQDMKKALETLFERATTAYKTLSDREARKEFSYLSSQAHVKSARRDATREEKREDDDTPPGLYNKGMRLYGAGDYLMALECFRKAGKLDPGNARYLYSQGLVFSQLPRKQSEAEDFFKKAIKLDPSKAEYHVNLADICVKRGLKPRALTVLNEALHKVSNPELIRKALTDMEEIKSA